MALLAALPGSVAQGLIWGILALGVYITYKLLDYADLTVDGSMCTGAAVGAVLILAGAHPLVAMLCAALAGMVAGLITGLLHTRLGIPAILSGILTQLALYSINLRIMGRATLALSVDKFPLLFSARDNAGAIRVGLIFAAAVVAALYWFFGTETGCAIRATGCNPNMARAQGINTGTMSIFALVISNGLVGLAGGLYAQYQGSADVNMGRGAIVIGLAAVIIGEVVFGNRFNFAYRLGAIVGGSVLYFVVIALVLQAGLSTTDLKLFSAVVVALALAIPYVISKRKGGVRRA